MGYFPVYLDLRGRRCVVIGDDDEAQMKAGALVEAGAVVTVISPEERPRFTEMAERGEITCTLAAMSRATSRTRSWPYQPRRMTEHSARR